MSIYFPPDLVHKIQRTWFAGPCEEVIVQPRERGEAGLRGVRPRPEKQRDRETSLTLHTDFQVIHPCLASCYFFNGSWTTFLALMQRLNNPIFFLLLLFAIAFSFHHKHLSKKSFFIVCKNFHRHSSWNNLYYPNKDATNPTLVISLFFPCPFFLKLSALHSPDMICWWYIK